MSPYSSAKMSIREKDCHCFIFSYKNTAAGSDGKGSSDSQQIYGICVVTEEVINIVPEIMKYCNSQLKTESRDAYNSPLGSRYLDE